MRVVFVHGACVKDGPWWWHRTAELLAERDVAGEAPAPFLDIDPEGGTFTVRPDALAETFLQDCAAEIQRQAADRTARQTLAVVGQPVRAAAWQQVATTYLVCAQDRGTPAERQREDGISGVTSLRRAARPGARALPSR